MAAAAAVAVVAAVGVRLLMKTVEERWPVAVRRPEVAMLARQMVAPRVVGPQVVEL